MCPSPTAPLHAARAAGASPACSARPQVAAYQGHLETIRYLVDCDMRGCFGEVDLFKQRDVMGKTAVSRRQKVFGSSGQGMSPPLPWGP